MERQGKRSDRGGRERRKGGEGGRMERAGRDDGLPSSTYSMEQYDLEATPSSVLASGLG
jgi:hypothetical protein